jgi:mono/diheme cytochrome c family protein
MVQMLLSTSVVLMFGGCAREELPPVSGAVLYHQYCESCHGPTGKGDGPVAPSLQPPPPADLTTLARRAGGRFDEAAVMAVIDGRRAVAAHGPRQMPIWGAVFEDELKDQRYTQYSSLLRSRVLADYLKTLQQ